MKNNYNFSDKTYSDRRLDAWRPSLWSLLTSLQFLCLDNRQKNFLAVMNHKNANERHRMENDYIVNQNIRIIYLAIM